MAPHTHCGRCVVLSGDVSNGNASNEHATDENAPRYIKYHTPATAGVWYYKILDSNLNEPPTPNPPNEHPANEDPLNPATPNPPNQAKPPHMKPLAVLLGRMGAPGLLEGLLGGPLIVLQGPPGVNI
ncbi:hypothetical protein BS47DRAFT_1368797 [Hydnum rufescens UP504]|uniref:Uncharacterized protein n=1 Tax=Hydnum rufescens UP504 TaxID=1448309 RepID=A0A9P6DMT0_9AGAM|nr:hypothetical protein BS47DRAFT_1368797 [Hydnum rufescens UP504]